MSRTASISAHPPTVGAWTIDTGVPGDGSIGAFNDLARRIVRDFQSTFGTLARVESIDADLIWFGHDGQVVRVEESMAVSFDDAGDIDLPERDVLVTAIFMDSALGLGIDPAPDATADVGGFSLVYTCVLEEENGRETPVDSRVTIATTANVWFGSENARSRQRLTGALMEWERLRGKPITEWHSSMYRTHMARYGFTVP
jgi:hypothetical protein